MLTFDLDLIMEQGHIVMTYFQYKVKVKGHDLGHYPAKLLKRFRFSQNVFTFLHATHFSPFPPNLCSSCSPFYLQIEPRTFIIQKIAWFSTEKMQTNATMFLNSWPIQIENINQCFISPQLMDWFTISEYAGTKDCLFSIGK